MKALTDDYTAGIPLRPNIEEAYKTCTTFFLAVAAEGAKVGLELNFGKCKILLPPDAPDPPRTGKFALHKGIKVVRDGLRLGGAPIGTDELCSGTVRRRCGWCTTSCWRSNASSHSLPCACCAEPACRVLFPKRPTIKEKKEIAALLKRMEPTLAPPHGHGHQATFGWQAARPTQVRRCGRHHVRRAGQETIHLVEALTAWYRERLDREGERPDGNKPEDLCKGYRTRFRQGLLMAIAQGHRKCLP